MSENNVKLSQKDIGKIHLQLFNKIDKEMDEFKASYKNLGVQQVYNDWYIIGFYESYHDMLSCDFLENQNAEAEMEWLYRKDKPLAFLYNEWMDSDGAFSHNWDDMLDFIRMVYEEELHKEPELLQLQNNHIGEFDILALMNTLANNAWCGISPTQICISAGDDVIKLEGYTYEPFYEDFSTTSSISFNDEVLYGLDSRNVAAYRNEVYNKGKFNTLDEAITHIKEQIKGKEPVLITEPQKLNDKIKIAIGKSKKSILPKGLRKDDVVLE